MRVDVPTPAYTTDVHFEAKHELGNKTSTSPADNKHCNHLYRRVEISRRQNITHKHTHHRAGRRRCGSPSFYFGHAGRGVSPSSMLKQSPVTKENRLQHTSHVVWGWRRIRVRCGIPEKNTQGSQTVRRSRRLHAENALGLRHAVGEASMGFFQACPLPRAHSTPKEEQL